MRSFVSFCRRSFLVVFLGIALTFTWSFTAVAQEAGNSRELERIEIEAPERRPAARPAPPTPSTADFDQDSVSDLRSFGDRDRASEIFAGTGIPSSVRSLATDKSQVSLGAASLPAQVQTINSQDIQQLNIWGREPADLFTKIAGMNTYYYNQGTLGLGVGMRGFTNANNIGFWVDGVPQNQPCQAGQGRVLIQWLPPEAIERIEIIKGPFSALYGDFAMAGVVNIVTKKSERAPSVSSYGGSFGQFRALGVLSSDTLSLTPYLVQEFYTIDGYRDNSELRQGSTFDKVSFPALGGVFSLRYNYFQSDWDGASYVPIDLIKSGLWNRRRPINPTDGGNVKMSSLVANYAPSCGERGLYASLYLAKYRGVRYDQRWPLSSSQKLRIEETLYGGGRLYYNLVFRDFASLTVGAETRQANGDQQQYATVNRTITSLTYDYSLSMANWGFFLQGQIKPHEKVKIVGGVRWDCFIQNFENITQPQNSGEGRPYVRSPKIGFVMTPTENFNFFGNIGCGFRSPSNTEVSPYRANADKDFGIDPAVVRTYDIGCNATLFGNLYVAADYYQTYMEREIATINNEPVNIGNSIRKGYELECRYYPSDYLDIFGNYAWVDAKVIDPINPGQFLVRYVPEHLIKAGVSAKSDFGPYGRIIADLYYEYYSGAPVYKNSTSTIPLYAPDYDVYNLKLTYSGRGWSSFLSARCQPREHSSSYFTVNNGLLTCDPPPKWELVSGLSYSFW